MRGPIQDCIQEILADLSPEPGRIAEAKRRATSLVETLGKLPSPFAVRELVFFGSVARETALNCFRLELLVEAVGAREAHPDALSLVSSILVQIADTKKSSRLALLNESADPLTVLDPATGKNVCGETDHEAKKQLIETCRWACDKLDEAYHSAKGGRSPRRVLREVFIGRTA